MKVKEALLESFGMLKERPKFVLPMIAPLVLGMGILGLTFLMTGVIPTGAGASPGWYLVPVVLALAVVAPVLSVLFLGMYPSIVKDRLEKRELNFKESFHLAYHKFGSMLGATLLAGVIPMAIMMAIIIPFAFTGSSFAIVRGTIVGIPVIFLILPLFYYIIPAIIMDDLKALAGFSKS